jgi:hypothetical protein
MSLRALNSPAAVIAVAVTTLALLVVGVASVLEPQPERRPSATPTPTAPERAAERDRVAVVPASAEVRREMRVLSNGCRYSHRGIPRCGTLLGAAYGSNSDPSPWEQRMARGLGVHRTYYAPDEVDEAVQTAQADLDRERMPWISFKLPFSWWDMASGAGDDWARGIAQRLARLDGPVWVAFHHEPEGDGDITHWTAVQERLAPIVRRTAPNVAYSVILTGWNQMYGDREYSLDELWPRTKIDLVGFDVYNKYGMVKDGVTITEHTLFRREYFTEFQEFAQQHDVAWALAETGYTDSAAEVESRFVERLYRGVHGHGGVAVSYFNSTINSVAPWRLIGSKERDFASVLRRTPTL